MATLALTMNLRRRWKEQRKSNNRRNNAMSFNTGYKINVKEIDGKYWKEARKMCQAIMAGKRIAGPQMIGTIISD